MMNDSVDQDDRLAIVQNEEGKTADSISNGCAWAWAIHNVGTSYGIFKRKNFQRRRTYMFV